MDPGASAEKGGRAVNGLLPLLCMAFGCLAAFLGGACLVGWHRATSRAREAERRRGWFEAFRPDRDAPKTPSGTLISRR